MTIHDRRLSDHDAKRAGLRRVLTPRQVRTCALAWQDGLSYREIAALHGIAERTVAYRIDQARRRLRAAGITPPGDPRANRTLQKPTQLSTVFSV